MNTHDEETLTTNKNAIHTYTPEELHWKPSSDEWSLAQVYDHTLVVAHEYLNKWNQRSIAKFRDATNGNGRRI